MYVYLLLIKVQKKNNAKNLSSRSTIIDAILFNKIATIIILNALSIINVLSLLNTVFVLYEEKIIYVLLTDIVLCLLSCVVSHILGKVGEFNLY